MQVWFRGWCIVGDGEENVQGNKPRFDVSKVEQECQGILWSDRKWVAGEEKEDEEIGDEAV